MKKVHDSDGNLIGKHNGSFVYSTQDETIIYRIDSDGDVFTKLSYDDNDLRFAEKGQEIAIGTLKENVCVNTSGQIIFTLESA